MLAKDFRRQAWDSLSNQWGSVILIYFVFMLITYAASLVSVVGLIISGPLTLGFTQIYMSVIRKNRKPEVGHLFEGFDNFSNSLILYLVNNIFIALWSLLFIVPGIIKTYSYSMSYYILADNPKMGGNEARIKSMQMMKGNKWRLFCLDFSFIGWDLLCILTLGILSFWVTPYRQAAYAAFYQNLLVEQGLIDVNEPVMPEDFVESAPTDV